MTKRGGPHHIGTTGASDGDVLTYDADADEYGPAAPSGGGSLTVQDENGNVATGVTQIDFQGAGVTATAGTGEVVVTVPGGGGGGSIKDRRWTVGPAETSIDEFNDSSLAGAWGRVDGANAPAVNVIWNEDADVLSANYTTGTDVGNASHALLRPLSGAGGAMAAGDAFVACINVFGPWGANFSVGSLMLTDGNTYGAGLQLSGEIIQGATMTNQMRKYSNFTTDTGGQVEGTFAPTQPFFVRIVYLGSSNWRFDRSPDDVSWVKGTSLAYSSFTPTFVGFGVRQNATTNKFVVAIDCLRRVAGIS